MVGVVGRRLQRSPLVQQQLVQRQQRQVALQQMAATVTAL
jgi:hypothetical protein